MKKRLRPNAPWKFLVGGEVGRYSLMKKRLRRHQRAGMPRRQTLVGRYSLMKKRLRLRQIEQYPNPEYCVGRYSLMKKRLRPDTAASRRDDPMSWKVFADEEAIETDNS